MFRSARPSLAVVGAFLAGLLIGWWVIGWWLWPVRWTNALPMDLLPAYRDTYVVGVAYALQVTGDVERARRSMEALGTGAEQRQALDSAMASYPASIEPLSVLGQTLQVPPPPRRPLAASEGGSWLRSLLLSAAIVLVLGLAILALQRSGRLPQRWPNWLSALRLWLMARVPSGGAPSEQPTTAPAPSLRDRLSFSIARDQEGAVPVGSATARPILGSFAPVYRRGMAEYNESYNLMTPDGKGYVGTCGMGIAETIDADDSQVAALEVWLFDKSDIRTHTLVLESRRASEHIAEDERAEVGSERIVAEPGQTFTIESQSLILQGRVVEVTYVEDETMPETIFQEVKVKMDVALR